MPLGAILAAVTEGSREAVLAVTPAVVTAAFPELHTEAASQGAALLEVASRVEADMVVGGIKRHSQHKCAQVLRACLVNVAADVRRIRAPQKGAA